MYYVKVKAGNRWSAVTAAGMPFTKVKAVEIADEDMVDEIKNHTMLEVTYTADAKTADEEPAITKDAQAMMEENGLSASAVAGTGKNGRITKSDVERALGGA